MEAAMNAKHMHVATIAAAALLGLAGAGEAAAGSSKKPTTIPRVPGPLATSEPAWLATRCGEPDPAPMSIKVEHHGVYFTVIGSVKNLGLSHYEAGAKEPTIMLGFIWGDGQLEWQAGLGFHGLNAGQTQTIEFNKSDDPYLEKLSLGPAKLILSFVNDGAGVDCHEGSANELVVNGPTAAQVQLGL
jgi:hypothetical protein